MDAKKLSRRHHRDRPMRHLTNDELATIMRLAHSNSLLRVDLAESICDLAMLAGMEDGEREMQEEMSR